MELLVSDTNVIIDLEIGGIIEELFLLSYQIGVPDVLYDQELQEHHAHLKELGLKTFVLESPTMVLAAELNNKYKRTSLMDCFALALALQERATLITGDRELRTASKKENAVLKGTIWLVEIMIIENIISTKKALQASKKMKQGDRRVPQCQFIKMLDRHKA